MSAKLKIQYSYLLSNAISERLYILNNKVGPNDVCFGQVLLYNFTVNIQILSENPQVNLDQILNG